MNTGIAVPIKAASGRDPKKVCSECRFVALSGNGQGLECRIRAPRATVFPNPGRDGRMGTITVGAWPPVQPQHFCGEWALALVLTS